MREATLIARIFITQSAACCCISKRDPIDMAFSPFPVVGGFGAGIFPPTDYSTFEHSGANIFGFIISAHRTVIPAQVGMTEGVKSPAGAGCFSIGQSPM